MKKTIFSLAALLLLMSNCSNEEIESEVTSQGKTSIKAVIEEPVIARATIDTESGAFSWTEGDKMDVNTTNGEKEFTYYSSTGTFESTEEVTVKDYAIYPSTVTYSNGKVTLPDSYTLGTVTNHVNATMLATNFQEGAESFKLKHLGGIVHFDFKNVPANANKLVFTADNTITGEFTIENEKISAPSNKVATKNVVSLNFTVANEARDLNFFVPVPTGSYKMQVALYADETLLYEGAGSTVNTIGRATLLNMPQIDCGSWYNEKLSVFTIVNKDQLKDFADKVNSGISFAGKTVKLAADLDMTGVEWTPIGTLSTKHYFKGTFDGGDHTISNLTINVTDGAAGLFGAVENCVAIKNVKLSKVNVSSNHYAGALVGWFQENGSTITPTISDCSVSDATIKVSPNTVDNGYDNGDKAGALVGYAASDVNITNCSVATATVTGYRDLGGIVGYANSTDTYGHVNITNCAVSNLTLVQDLSNGYKTDYPSTLGAVYGGGSSSDITDNSTGLTSLTIKNCTPAYAQGALDAANTPRTIELTTGEFGDLLLRINDNSELTSYYYIMGNYDSNYYGQEAWRYAKRTISGLTITGVDGTVINSLTTPADRDDDGNVKGTRNNMFEINNLKISNVTISKSIYFSTTTVNVATSSTTSEGQPHVKIEGITIENCKTTANGDKTKEGGRKLIGIANTGSDSNVKDIVIKGCTVTDMYQGVYIVDGENVEVSGCTFSGLTHNAVHINKFCSGTISITGNNMSYITERPIRLNGVQSGNITIERNTITNSGDTNGEYYKASSMNSSVIVTWSNNTADGTEIVLSGTENNQIGKKKTTDN